jgi:RNA polymerase sigma-70 factor, ECF subfamily
MNEEPINIDEIVDAYFQKLYKLCLFYLNNKEEAEEVLQEIFIKVLKKKSSFKARSAIYTWLYRIAVNTLINHINRKKIIEFISLESSRPMKDETAGSFGLDPAVSFEADETQRLKLEKLDRCIRKLSNREKTAFYLFHYDNLSQKEIAEVMKTSLSAVESLIHKSMKKLQWCVKT